MIMRMRTEPVRLEKDRTTLSKSYVEVLRVYQKRNLYEG